ncbi:MAG: 2-hydroxyacid dehydrogenase [Elusimicrobiota bacterium]
MKPNVYVTRRIPEPGLDLLRRRFDVEVSPHDRPLSREELLTAVKGRAAVLTQLVDKVDKEFFEAARGVRVVANYAVGYDNIDLAAARRAGAVVTNTPGVLTRATAELAWALLFAAARRVAEGDVLTRSGGFRGWGPMLLLGTDVSGKTLGIVGAGRIGTAMALMSKGFGMNVLYSGRSRNETLEKELGARKTGLEDLLRESDFVSVHARLTAETRGLIGKAQLAMMKPTAVLINTARGPVVDEAALVDALRSGRLFAAGLDVYEKEPSLAPGLAELPNAVLLPHAGSATVEARERMSLLAAENIAAVLEGRAPPSPVEG